MIFTKNSCNHLTGLRSPPDQPDNPPSSGALLAERDDGGTWSPMGPREIHLPISANRWFMIPRVYVQDINIYSYTCTLDKKCVYGFCITCYVHVYSIADQKLKCAMPERIWRP